MVHRRTRVGPHGGALLGALLCSLALAAPATAADPLSWAPTDAKLALVFRGADTPAAVLDALKARFGHVPRVAALVDGLAAWTPVEGVQPLGRKWGDGLAPGKGLALYSSQRKHFRLVIGISDPDVGRRTISRLLGMTGAQVQATSDGLVVDDKPIKCTSDADFLVCDSLGVSRPDAPPAWVEGAPVPTDQLGLLYMGGEFITRFADGAVAEAYGAMSLSGDRLSIQAELIPAAQARQPLAMLAGEDARSSLLPLVDLSTPFVAHVGVNSPTIFEELEKVVGRPPPGVAPLWQALKANWSGEVAFAADGGFTQVVALLGLQKAAGGGRALLDAVLKAAADENPELRYRLEDHPRKHPGLKSVTMIFGEGPEQAVVRLPWAQVPAGQRGALVLGFSPADVIRRLDGKVRPLELDPAFTASNVHGFVFPGLPGGWGGFFFAEMFEAGPGPGSTLLDAQLLLSIAGELVDEVGLQIRPTPKAVKAEMWWRFL